MNEFSTRNKSMPSYDSVFIALKKILRDDVLYVTVSQSDIGLTNAKNNIKNILVLSAGGYGHVPIPLIKGELDYVPPPNKFEWVVGFYGRETGRRHRQNLLLRMKKLLRDEAVNAKFGMSADWQERIAKTAFNLSPRGIGRQSYRTVEILQIGRIPVYMYNDVPWIPYAGSGIEYDSIGFACNDYSASHTVKMIKNTSESALSLMMTRVREVRKHYTYMGVIHQIELFFRDPMGPNGGFLRCAAVPATATRQ